MNYGKKKPVKKAPKKAAKKAPKKATTKAPMMTYGGAMSEATRQIKMKKGGKTPTALISALKAAGHLTYGGPSAMAKKKKKKK